MFRRWGWILLPLVLGGCALAQRSGRQVAQDLSVGDSSSTPGADLGSAGHVDFAGVDLTGVDLTTAPPPPPADMATGSCDPVLQSGCMIGEKCTLGLSSVICVNNGTQPRGAACGATGDDECTAGNVCVHETNPIAACRELCRVDADCTQPAAAGGAKNVAHCLNALNGSTVKACTIACDPVAGTCDATLTCRYQGTGSIAEFTECGLPGATPVGMPCTKQEDCAPALSCSMVNGSQKCRKVCHAGSLTDCPSGYTCASPAIASPMFGICSNGT